MVEIVCNLYEMEGISKVTFFGHLSLILTYLKLQDTAEKNARKVFGQLDIDRDGELNEDEFVKGCLKVLVKILKMNFHIFLFRTQPYRTCSMGQQNDLKIATIQKYVDLISEEDQLNKKVTIQTNQIKNLSKL